MRRTPWFGGRSDLTQSRKEDGSKQKKNGREKAQKAQKKTRDREQNQRMF
jgi:hypothetical protein